MEVPGEDEFSELTRSFNRMSDALAATEQRRLLLTADVAHERRTPLTNIRTMLEALSDGVLPADASTYNILGNEVRRLQRLVHDLQELSQTEAGQMPFPLEPSKPESLISGVQQRLTLQFHEKEGTLHVSIEDNLPAAMAYPAHITQVLVSIQGNALQYTPFGGSEYGSGPLCRNLTPFLGGFCS